ncbi:class I SAM-dependent methyltransferase [Pseudophaeobacter flagellatus]|uniref:class I SAM-dependent methyltransferase n=1 Tax=Pseudophaeobacter flagellatus TaxID=2899119 RepID=UPI001E585FA5|nr:class I SAM-dependent methyltransferase [Pseudophaeobacter flagellatus]MCD9147650.1 class I SAM-dependent methyltransferase [Pseudophaeobacter flagellatus]
MIEKTSDFAASTGAGYELQMGRFSRLLASGFLDFSEISDNGLILDAGCGTGSLTAEMQRRTSRAQIVGVDISPAYIAHAQKSISDTRTTFDVADLTTLPFPDAHFGQAFSQLVLDFIPETDLAFKELFRVLKPGAQFSAAVWDARGGLVFNRMFLDTAAVLDEGAEALRKKNFTRPLRQPGQLKQVAVSAGFTDVREGEVMIRTEFTSFDDYWVPFDGEDGPIPAYLSKRPAEMKSKIKDAVRLAYLDGDDDGPRSYVAVALAISAVRTA